ncbi:KRAB-A domain-containing protein 2-like [Acyrthosiphon pisum]|uniref:Integrase catalytic domain-containing protein n=1 Tax=Acyrthosiphon pisum TaxID=7029 RepID=A0A8R2D4A8_ACYPI|nr:KRAB-A domain-containing protein 2-like [Acyrthosiphon pisum]|eukprot:XP_016659939.1 PREDICTED: KRAB-A domain-containing protein 2-like [Acyrthosiphon pisum]
MDIMDNHKLIVPLKACETKIIYYVKNEELYDIMYEAHIKIVYMFNAKPNKKFRKKGILIKPIISREINSRCQVDLDHLTKFTQLRPLKSKTAEEDAHHLLNIFLIFGAPNILHSDNGREFVNKVISELCSMWDGVNIVHGKPRHSQKQGSIERANQDFQNILRAMMKDNDTTK